MPNPRKAVAMALNLARRASGGPVTSKQSLAVPRRADGGGLDTEAPSAQTFLSDLARNPRGWGTKLPLQPEMRSALSPEAERIGSIYGPEMGHYFQGVLDASDTGKDVALGVSGLGLGNEGMNDIVEGNPGQGALKMGVAAAPFAGPAMRGMGAAMRYAPKATGLAALLGGATAFPAMSGDKVSLDEQLKRLEDARDATAKQRDLSAEEYRAQIGGKSGRKAGSGPLSTQMDAQLKPLNDQITDFNSQIAAIKHQMSPNYKREQDLIDANNEARKPWYERTGVPGFETAATWGPVALAALATRGKFNKLADEGTGLLGDVRNAASLPEEATARLALKDYRSRFPWEVGKTTGKAMLLPGAVRTVGNVGDMTFGPEVHDAQGKVQPGGAKQQAQEHFDRMFGKEGFGPAIQQEWGPMALSGAEAVAAAGMFSRRPPLSKIAGENAQLRGLDSGKLSPDQIAIELAKRRAGLPGAGASSLEGPTPLWSQAMRGEPTNLALPPPRSQVPEYPGSPTMSPRTSGAETPELPAPTTSLSATATNPAVAKALSVAKARPQANSPELVSPKASPAATTSSVRGWRGRIKSPHGYRWKKGSPESVGGRFAEGPKSTKKQNTPKELTTGKEQDVEPVEPGKPSSAEDYFNDPSKLTGGMKTGGSVLGKALSLARKYANGGTVGPLVGNTGGRSDKLARSVPAGSHVIPADVVSHLGEGNSLGGLKMLEQKYGTVSRSTGGEVPVMLSDGEFVVSPEMVAREGGGDPNRGHAAIDRFILGTRDHAIKTLKSLPPPSR